MCPSQGRAKGQWDEGPERTSCVLTFLQSLKLLLGLIVFTPGEASQDGPLTSNQPAPFPGAYLDKPGPIEPSSVLLLSSQILLSSPAVSLVAPFLLHVAAVTWFPGSHPDSPAWCACLIQYYPPPLHWAPQIHVPGLHSPQLPAHMASSTQAPLHGMYPPFASLSQHCSRLYSVTFLCCHLSSSALPGSTADLCTVGAK